ncbi:hypothetical protein AVDCRST_MAG94-5334 [uncultured Leptolyngbya sp.]|uniref:Uncharacterized protein n=1 Tax=uncultured Leptolyngbya sp. TaxID=332963 RepID=A0A6J4NQL2_9CYAN|nr:hypothetical protein AVDCRST_MAG94-5334 [uncultured Leptolyngbya sp.]
MPSNQAAIARFRSHEKIEVNANPVYATYTSGSFNGFYATEQEAIDHCSNPENGAEFNDQWFQDRYTAFAPGELFAVVGNESVYISNDKSRFIDAVFGRGECSFVEWKAEAPLAV